MIRTHALPCYARLTKPRFSTLDRVFFAPGFLRSDYKVLYFGGTQVLPKVRRSTPRADAYAKFLDELLLTGLKRARAFPIVTTDREFLNYDRYKLRAVQLKVFLSYASEGSALVRYFVGYDLGAVDVQVEGQLIDTQTGEPLIEFADRRQNAGDPQSGLNPTVLSAPKLVRSVLREQANEIVKIIRSHP